MILLRWPASIVRAVLIGTALTLAVPVFIPDLVSAQAGEFYTRKRVNGVWITGQFRRKHSAAPAKASEVAKVEKATKTEKPVAQPPVKVSYLDPADDRKPAFQRAVEARQAMRQADGMPATEDVVRLLPLQRALEAKARSLATMLPPPRNVKTVTYDFDTGLRTSIYSDGTIAEEPFDSATGSISLLPR
jgi:hypothetical protein